MHLCTNFIKKLKNKLNDKNFKKKEIQIDVQEILNFDEKKNYSYKYNTEIILNYVIDHLDITMVMLIINEIISFSPNTRFSNLQSLTHKIILTNNSTYIRYLLNINCTTVNAINQFVKSPLDIAIDIHASIKIVQLLLEKGAKVSNINIHQSIDNNNIELFSLLIKYFDFVLDFTIIKKILHDSFHDFLMILQPLHQYININHNPSLFTIAEFKKILQYTCPTNNTDSIGKRTALHNTSYIGLYDHVEALLKWGTAIDPVDYNQRTPLHEAIINNNVSIVSLLIHHGANKNLCCNNINFHKLSHTMNNALCTYNKNFSALLVTLNLHKKNENELKYFISKHSPPIIYSGLRKKTRLTMKDIPLCVILHLNKYLSFN